MKKTLSLLAVAALLASHNVSAHAAFNMSDIQLWAGTGSNSAAMVIQWNSPLVFDGSAVPPPAANPTMVWGYHFNGTATGEEMLTAIFAADHNLFGMISPNTPFGKSIFGMGYDANHNGVYGLTDGSTTYTASSFTNGLVTGDTNDVDFFTSTDPADVYWGGWFGPGWEPWSANTGATAPDRGADPYWTTSDGFSGDHGQWHYSDFGLSTLPISDGTWMGWTVAPGGLGASDAGTTAWSTYKQAPADYTAAPVPEPATCGLLLCGAVGLLARRRR